MRDIKEKELKGINGWIMLGGCVAGLIAGMAMMVAGPILATGPSGDDLTAPGFLALIAPGILLFVASILCFAGLKVRRRFPVCGI